MKKGLWSALLVALLLTLLIIRELVHKNSLCDGDARSHICIWANSNTYINAKPSIGNGANISGRFVSDRQ